jgi:uncharacterized protein YjbI with pentapeptide repeats
MQRKTRGQPGTPQAPQYEHPFPSEPTIITELEAGTHYVRQRWVNLAFDGQEAEDVSFEQLQLAGVRMQQARLPLLQAVDTRWETSDVAGGVFEKAYLRRVEFQGCRLLGTSLLNSDLEDVRFTRCMANMLRVWTSRCRSVRFEHCSLCDASFDGADLAGVVFENCDLTGADFRNANMKGTDLRGSTITRLQIGARELTGVIVDPAQAVQLIQLFGVVVR